MDLTLYKKRIVYSDMKTAYIEDTANILNDIFLDSLSVKQITLDSVVEDAIINNTKYPNRFKILLKPKKNINMGSYVVWNMDTYITIKCNKSELYPKGEIALCNSTLKWKDNLGVLKEYKCLATGSSFDLDDQYDKSREILSSDAELSIIVQYNQDTKLIMPTQRFLFGKFAYEVDKVDMMTYQYNEIGYIKLSVNSISVTSTDDTDTGVADTSGNSGWGEW